MRFTLSGLTRAKACPGHLVLPWTRSSDQYTTAGNVMDAFLKAIPEVGVAKALEAVPEEHRTAMGKIDLEALAPFLAPGHFVSDLAVAYDPKTDTARELTRGKSRAEAYQGLKPHEVGGTLDLGALSDDAVVIVDYKRSWRDRGPLVKHDQLRAYAAVLARVYGKDRGLIIRIRILESGDPWIDTLWLDAMELDATLFDIQRVAEVESGLVQAESVDVSVGDHCSYCPAMPACPAHAKLVAGANRKPNEAVAIGGLGPPLTPETLPDYLMVITRLRATADYLETRCEKLGREAPIKLENGFVYGEFIKARESIDGEKAKAVLQGSHPAHWAIAVKPKVTKDSLEDLARELKKEEGGTQKRKKAELLDLLRKEGAAVIEHKPTVGVFHPKELESGE